MNALNMIKICGLSLTLVVVTGCSTIDDMRRISDVKPWQKNILAKDSMQLNGSPVESYFDSHTYFSKEASTGGSGIGGGGCGCN